MSPFLVSGLLNGWLYYTSNIIHRQLDEFTMIFRRSKGKQVNLTKNIQNINEYTNIAQSYSKNFHYFIVFVYIFSYTGALEISDGESVLFG